MHVTTRGASEAPALILLHGGIGTGTYHWGKQAEALQDLFCVHLPDLPGHGQSPLDDPDSYSRDTLVAAVDEYVQKVGPPVHLGGFSMGGHTALALVERYPDIVQSLVLVGVSVRDHDGLGKWQAQFHPDRLARDYPFWAKQLSRLHAPLGGDDAWREVCLRDSQSRLRFDVDLNRLAAVDAPVLLIRGDRDPTVQVEQYAELRATFPRSEEAVVPAGGHDVQLTRAELVKPLLRDFYERVMRD
jgi:3-oxoadipate enol-lactonase